MNLNVGAHTHTHRGIFTNTRYAVHSCRLTHFLCLCVSQGSCTVLWLWSWADRCPSPVRRRATALSWSSNSRCVCVCVCVRSCQCVSLFKLLWHLEEQWGADRKATDITSVTHQTKCHTDNGTTSTNEWCSVRLVSITWLIFFHHSRSLAAVIVSIRSAGRSNLGRRCWRHSRGTGWVCVLI